MNATSKKSIVVDKEIEAQETQDAFVTAINGNKRKDILGESSTKSQFSNPNKKSNTRSIVWEHYTRTEDNRDKCKCHYCKKLFCCSPTSVTSNLQKHLSTCKHFKAWQQNQTQHIIAQDGNLQNAKVSDDVFRKASNEMIVLGQLPLAFIESIAWRHFCNRVNLYKPLSRRTATRDIVQMHAKKKNSSENWIATYKPRVSITTDIWVAKVTGASYMVITIHFMDENWHLRKLIIGFKYITDHKGQTISSVLLECLAEWVIEKVFTITVDNATANNSALRKFQRDFKILRSDALVLGGEFMHVKCCAHILNLIVKEGLQELGDNVAAIRNAIQYVRSSTSRYSSFELRVVTGKMTRGSLPLDVKTLWNSTYLMLTRAIKFKLAFNKMEAEDRLYNDYFQEVENGKKRIGPPNTIDWNAVKKLVRFLIIFYNSTLVVSASTSVCSYKCYGEIVTIKKNLMSLSNSLDEDLRSKANAMRDKFDKYWDGMKQINRLLIVATVFDPRKKMQFAKMCFEKLYGTESLEAKEMYDSVFGVLCCLFKEYSANKKRSTTPSSQSTQTSFSSSQDRVVGDITELLDDDMVYERMDFAYKEMVAELRVENSRDELEIYLKETVESPKTILGSEWNVLSWWKINSPKYPILSEITRDVLAMQVSSVASESAFSTSGCILEPHRSCLSHYMIEVLMCTEQWMKGVMQLSEKTFDTIAEMLADVEMFDQLEKEFDTQINLD